MSRSQGKPVVDVPTGNGGTALELQPQQGMQRPTAETSGQVLAAQAEALVKARYMIAVGKPRDLDVARRRLLDECKRPSFANTAIYHKPIGQGVEGPSIRFAEAAMQLLGNLAVDVATIYDDDEKRILRVSCLDLETNTGHTKDIVVMKRVERRTLGRGQVALRTRTNSRGDIVHLVAATDDEMLNTENALVSKALRTVGLRLVPGWLIDEAMTQCRATRENSEAKDPDAAKRALFDAFATVGVSVEKVKAYLGHDGATLTAKERTELKGLYTALRDGETTWREVMDGREVVEKPAAAKPQAAPAASQEPPPKSKAEELAELDAATLAEEQAEG